MFTYKAVLRHPGGATYRLERLQDGTWHLYCDDNEVQLARDPSFRRDGGSTRTTLASGDSLVIPQQRMVTVPKVSTLNGEPLELIEWRLNDECYLNGVKM